MANKEKKEETRLQSGWNSIKRVWLLWVTLCQLGGAYVLYFDSRLPLKVVGATLGVASIVTLTITFINKEK